MGLPIVRKDSQNYKYISWIQRNQITCKTFRLFQNSGKLIFLEINVILKWPLNCRPVEGEMGKDLFLLLRLPVLKFIARSWIFEDKKKL